MKRFIYMLAAFALMGAVSCQPDEEVAVHASFTTDKESYDVGDPVVLTNTSTAENALIAICNGSWARASSPTKPPRRTSPTIRPESMSSS